MAENKHLDNLKAICKQVGDAIAMQIDRENPDDIIEKINTMTALLSTSSHAVALSDLIYNEKIMQLAEDTNFSGMTATDKKMIFAGRAKNEIYYMTLADRQNRAIVHNIDGLRSIISFLKSEKQQQSN